MIEGKRKYRERNKEFYLVRITFENAKDIIF